MITQLTGKAIAENEFWDVPGYEGIYQIDKFGNVRGLNRVVYRGSIKCRDVGRFMKISTPANHYPKVCLSKDGKRRTHLIHRILAQIFIPNPENKKEVNHKDGNKHNNNLSNLEWVTRRENSLHSVRIGLQSFRSGKDSHRFGRPPGNAKSCQCLCTGRVLSYAVAAKEVEVGAGAIARMMRGARVNWTHFIPIEIEIIKF